MILTPHEIVCELDRFIVGQEKAKRCVANALRNRWRRQQLTPELRDEILPKNILMVGPTGCGKTEIARRLARLAHAPFVKVEATKFTEVGYVGRDVEQIIRDLVEISIHQTKEQYRETIEKKALAQTEDKILDALVGEKSGEETRQKFKKMLNNLELEDKEIEISVPDQGSSSLPTFDIPGVPGAQMGMVNIGDFLGKAFSGRMKTKSVTVQEGRQILLAEESDKLLDKDKIVQTSLEKVEQNGIVFIDEVDKICTRSKKANTDISREGVQRDLLPLLEGTTVSTKHGLVKTDHILFIASGAFHLSKPSDLLPELQGRLPTRVELKPLGEDDFVKILTQTESSLIRQYEALLSTENVTLLFTPEGIKEIAIFTARINADIEDTGARRLHTVLECILEDISYTAPEKKGETLRIDAEYVREKVSDLAKKTDVSKFIL